MASIGWAVGWDAVRGEHRLADELGFRLSIVHQAWWTMKAERGANVSDDIIVHGPTESVVRAAMWAALEQTQTDEGNSR